MIHFIISLLSLLPTQADTDALVRFAPDYLTRETAAVHLFDARVAARVNDVDPDLVLAIAWHESRFTIARTNEPGGLVSCGVMTPVPMRTCESTTVMDGYLAGAAHLRGWLDACHQNVRCALLGYAGGYRMIEACRTGSVLVERAGRSVDLCTVVGVFQAQARSIVRLRAAYAAS